MGEAGALLSEVRVAYQGKKRTLECQTDTPSSWWRIADSVRARRYTRSMTVINQAKDNMTRDEVQTSIVLLAEEQDISDIFAVSADAPASSNRQKMLIQTVSNHTRLDTAFFLNKSMATVGIMNTTPNAPTKMRNASIWKSCPVISGKP